MLYQIALNLHKVLNSDSPLTFEKISLLDQMVCGRRQLKFEILRNFQGKIGMNTMANKFYHVSNLIGLDLLNLGFVHYKKSCKNPVSKIWENMSPVSLFTCCTVTVNVHLFKTVKL